MKKINLIIWDQMDTLRDGSISDEYYMRLCRECINNNDIRFRIKNKIKVGLLYNLLQQIYFLF